MGYVVSLSRITALIRPAVGNCFLENRCFIDTPEKYVGDARARLESVIGEGVVKLE